MSHRVRQNKRIAIETQGEMWVDTGADTTCSGAGFTVFVVYAHRYVTLRGYSDSSDEDERVPVVTAATAIDLDDGMTVIRIINEVLWLGDSQYTSLLNLNQVRYAGHQADGIPLFLSQGSSIHGIKMKDEIHIPFSLKGKSSLMYIHMLTAKEMEECEHIELTSDEPWDPTDVDWEENEDKFKRKYSHAWNAVSSIHQEDEGIQN